MNFHHKKLTPKNLIISYFNHDLIKLLLCILLYVYEKKIVIQCSSSHRIYKHTSLVKIFFLFVCLFVVTLVNNNYYKFV